jgi:putative redox protein
MAEQQTPKPPVSTELTWEGGFRLRARVGAAEVVLDSDNPEHPSPVQALGVALAGCMAMDVVLVLTKARQPLEGLRVALTGTRADDHPRRFVGIDLRFFIRGRVSADHVQRAIALSRDKYCSVWHSMRHDIPLDVSFEISPDDGA